jgi:tRNA modification GTPase
MDDTIAAISSPFGQGAVAILRVSGPKSREIVGGIYRAKIGVEAMCPRLQHLGRIVDAKGEVVDQVLVTAFDAPASYTGEDMVEIGCHGGLLVTRRIFDLLLAAGARAAEPGEFTQRAFLNGKMDLTQAEAVMDLIEARTALALRAANAQLEGRLGDRATAMREDLLGLLAHVEAYIDFPEEDIDPDTGEAMAAKMEAVLWRGRELIATAEQGRLLREGAATVICGAPNVGKSSLLNVLLGFERAIVSETAGTTRDTIEEVIQMKGLALRLIDTAGVRESEDAIEREGIARTEKQVANADLVLEVVDGSQPRSEGAAPVVLEGSAARHLRIINKCDLGEHPSWHGIEGIRLSCRNEEGIDALSDAIFERLTGGEIGWGANLVAINARHRACLARAAGFLEKAIANLREGQSPEFLAADLRVALDAVGEIVGKVDTEDLLDVIFGAFCIGK